MQDFSEWMTALQQHGTVASSYAETDNADSDSDDADRSCDDCQCGRPEPKRMFAAQRTAPIRIPPARRQQRLNPHLCESAAESPDLSYHADMRLLRAGRYLHEDDELLDEDDPAFYGNLAFFRSQCGASQSRTAQRRAALAFKDAAPASPTGVDGRDDEDIFAMEL